MKASLLLLTLAAALFLLPPAFAQHGHSGAAIGGGMSHGNVSADHGNATASSQSSTQGKTVSQLLTQNKQLASKINSLTGEDAQTACSGFKNLGQCVAAAHVSKNRGITFDCLKADMTGQPPSSQVACPAATGSKSMSLGKAIQTLDPSANANSEVKKANQQANQDLKNSGSSS